MRLSMHLLGSLHVTLDEESVSDFESNKVRALLVYLALEADRPHSREELIGLLWPDRPERAARRSLSQALFNLRQTIHDEEADPPFLHICHETVQFNLDSDYWLDVSAFAAHLAAAHSHVSADLDEGGLDQLDRADALYRGEFLAGFFVDDSAPFSDWAVLWRERLHRQALDAQQRLAEHYERRCAYAPARHYAWRQVELEPWREEAHQQLMRLLARTGQRSAALQQYETCRRILADELGIEPSEDTKHLYRRLKSLSGIGSHNLPPQATRFVGRATELQQIARHLADPCCRLLTLTGPGGIGKSRLAIQAAHEHRLQFLDGVCFVPLAALQSAEFLALTMADALHIRGQGDVEGQLLAALRGRELLLVLDNFEHLIEDGADLLITVLQAAPELKLLVTSRERLNVYGETVFEVSGLALPEEDDGRVADGGAVELFAQCAAGAHTGFNAGDELADIARICRLVDGMPLGIELAAVWVRTLSCRHIAAEIERSLAFLNASLRGVPARHRSVQAAFDHSWERLPLDERRAFSRLSVFYSGFDQQAARHVAGATCATLSALVDKSFLKEAQAGRYVVHNLLRQYAAAKLAQDAQDAQSAQDEHCRYYANLVSSAAEQLQSGQQRAALDLIALELDNVRAAWQWSIDQQRHDRLATLLPGLYEFCFNRSRQEGDLLFGKAVAAVEAVCVEQPETKREVQRLLGQLLWRWGYFVRITYATDEQTGDLLRRSISLLRAGHDQEELAQALHGLGRFLEAAGRFTEARQALEESVAISRQLPDPRHLARSLTGLGVVARCADETPYARELIQEGLAIQRQLNDLKGIANSLSALSSVAYYAGDQTEAKGLCLEAKAILEELGNEEELTVIISNVGHVCLELGEYDAALQYLQETLRRSIAQCQTRFTLNILHGLAELSRKLGRDIQAYELALYISRDPLAYGDLVTDVQQLLHELETRLPHEATAAATTRTAAWTMDDAVAEALALFE